MELLSDVITTYKQVSGVGSSENYTSPVFTGIVPKLAIIETTLSRASEASTYASGWGNRTKTVIRPATPGVASDAVGFSVCEYLSGRDDSQFGVGSFDGTYDTVRRNNTIYTTVSDDYLLDYTWEFINAGIKCNFYGSAGYAGSGEYFCVRVILLGGDGFVGADFTSVDLSSGATAVNVTGLSVDPNCVIAMMNNCDTVMSLPNNIVPFTYHASSSWGIAVKDPSGNILQGSQRVANPVDSDSDVFLIQASGREVLGSMGGLVGDLTADRLVTQLEVELDSFTAGGFNTTLSSPTGSSLTTQSQILFCALEFDKSVDLDVSMGSWGTGSDLNIPYHKPIGNYTGVHRCSVMAGADLGTELAQPGRWAINCMDADNNLALWSNGFMYLRGASSFNQTDNTGFSGSSLPSDWSYAGTNMRYTGSGDGSEDFYAPITANSTNSWDVLMQADESPVEGNYLNFSFIQKRTGKPNIYLGSTRATDFNLGEVTPKYGAQGVNLFAGPWSWKNLYKPLFPGIVEFFGWNKGDPDMSGFPSFLDGSECISIVQEIITGSLTIQSSSQVSNTDAVFSNVWIDGSNILAGIPLTRSTATFTPWDGEKTTWAWAYPALQGSTPMWDTGRTFYGKFT